MASAEKSRDAKWTSWGDANPQSVFVALFGVVRPEVDHNENETDQRRGGRADERVEIAPTLHDVSQSSPPVPHAIMAA